jgi:hypothetical protein
MFRCSYQVWKVEAHTGATTEVALKKTGDKSVLDEWHCAHCSSIIAQPTTASSRVHSRNDALNRVCTLVLQLSERVCCLQQGDTVCRAHLLHIATRVPSVIALLVSV